MCVSCTLRSTETTTSFPRRDETRTRRDERRRRRRRRRSHTRGDCHDVLSRLRLSRVQHVNVRARSLLKTTTVPVAYRRAECASELENKSPPSFRTAKTRPRNGRRGRSSDVDISNGYAVAGCYIYIFFPTYANACDVNDFLFSHERRTNNCG